MKITIDRMRKELEDAKWNFPAQKIKEYVNLYHELLSCVDFIPRPFSYKNKPFLNTFTRICIGAHGPYVEFKREHLLVDIKLAEGQEWRASKKYQYVKYEWWTPTKGPGIKIYLQKHDVKYADYKPGFYYVDLLLLI